MVAFGRDNTGVFANRIAGNITLEYTRVGNPSSATLDSSWVEIDTVVLSSALRHLYALNTPTFATALRLRLSNSTEGTIVLDEFEAYADTGSADTTSALSASYDFVASQISSSLGQVSVADLSGNDRTAQAVGTPTFPASAF